MRKELKSFYKVISVDTLFWVLLMLSISFFVKWLYSNFESISLQCSCFNLKLNIYKQGLNKFFKIILIHIRSLLILVGKVKIDKKYY